MGHELVSRPSTLLNKRFLAGVVAAVAVGTVPVANAEIELGEGLSVTGFVDMSLSGIEDDATPANFGIDQFEVDFMFSGSNGVSAQVDVEFGGTSGTPDTFVEQAFVTKSFGDMFSVKVGRFLSYSGWETEEPTGLFQYSGAGLYSPVGYGSLFYGGYQQGVSVYYDGGMFDLMGSFVTHPTDPTGMEFETDEMGYELGAAVMPIEGLTAKLFYIVDTVDGGDDTKIINFWTSYAWNGFTFAGEYSTADFGGGVEADGFLLMGNYATGPYGITLRYASSAFDGGEDATSITLAPSYKVGDNLLLVAEYRQDDFGPFDANSFALEALFTF